MLKAIELDLAVGLIDDINICEYRMCPNAHPIVVWAYWIEAYLYPNHSTFLICFTGCHLALSEPLCLPGCYVPGGKTVLRR